MSGMTLHLDEFHEGENRRRLDLEISTEEAEVLFKDTEYQAAGPLHADLEVNLVGTTIRVFGPVETTVGFDCGRCLEHREQPISVDAEFVLMEQSEWAAKYEDDASDDYELADDDMDVSFYEGEDIDLSPFVREAILLELPTLPRCPESGRQACDDAYRQNVGEAALDKLEEASLDQRWAALKNFKLKD